MLVCLFLACLLMVFGASMLFCEAPWFLKIMMFIFIESLGITFALLVMLDVGLILA